MKIKKVDITGFRAYGSNGNGNFDFMLNSGQVADFVSIYAPNGFGKSSFYDAIEWALTNNISRFIREGLRQNNDSTSRNLNNSEEGQNILRNRYMPKSEESYVTIETTKQKPLKKVLKQAQKGKRDFTFDPKSTDQNAKHLTDIFLSQDAIDAFLKEDKPETRYEKFMSHFGGNDEQYRLKLTILKKTCFTQRTTLTAELSEVNIILQEPLQTESLQLANTTIRELNELNESFDLLDHNFTVQDDIRLKNKLAQLKLSSQTDLDNVNSRLKSIDECKIGAIEFFKNRTISIEVNSKLNKLKSNLQFIETRNKSLAFISELENKLSTQVSELEVNQNLLSTHEEYRKLQEQRKNHKNSLDKFIRGKQENEAVYLSLKQKIKDLNTSLEINDILYREQIDNVKNAHAKYADLDSIEKEIVALEDENDKASKRLETAVLLKHDISQKIERVVNLNVDIDSNTSTNSSALYTNAELLGYNHVFIEEFLDLIQSGDLLKIEIDTYSDEQQRLGSDQESIYKLITLAGDLISNSRQDSCPVCEQQYSSHEALLKKINANIGFSEHQKDIASRKQKSEADLYLLNDHLKQKLVIIDDLKALKLNSLNVELSKTIDESLKVENENLQRVTRLNSAKEKLNGLKNTLHSLSFAEYLAQCSEKIDLSSEKKSELHLKLNEIKKEIEQVEISMLAQSSEIVLCEALINNIETSSSFLQMQNYFASHSISIGEEGQFLISHHETLKSSIANIRKEIEKLKLYVASEEQNKAFSNEIFNKTLMENEIEALSARLRQADENLVIFQAKIQFLEPSIEVGDVTDEKLENLINIWQAETTKTYQFIKNKVEYFNLLNEQLTTVLPFIKYIEAKQKAQDLSQRINEYTLLKSKLDQEFSTVEKRLEERISSFFYTDLINNIYSKIDPHPTFKRVEFKCIFPESDQPRLEVYLHEKNGTPISPNLYFSAAQLNILSLSIFLARALHVEHEGEPVETILIDDPIHSMDSINILSTIDLLRNLSINFGRQIILSTHDENFYELLKMKMPSESFKSKFIKLESYGKVALAD